MTLLLRAIRKSVPIVAVLLCCTSYSQEIEAPFLTESHLVGTATYGIAFWDMYDLSLYSEQVPFVEGEPPYALEIKFLKDYTNSEYVDRVVSQVRENGINDEMRLAQWHSRFLSFFPDVENGTVITAIYNIDRETHFYVGEEYLGHMRDPRFGRRFFSIWVGDKGAESKVRDQLLGMNN